MVCLDITVTVCLFYEKTRLTQSGSFIGLLVQSFRKFFLSSILTRWNLATISILN